MLAAPSQAPPIPVPRLRRSGGSALSSGSSFLQLESSILTVANFSDDKSALDALRSQHDALLAEVGKVIVGQDRVIREVTTAILQAGTFCLRAFQPGQNPSRQHRRSGPLV